MKIKQYKAKAKNRNYFVYGSYVNMPDHTPYPIGEFPEKLETLHFIVSYSPGDWGLPGKFEIIPIDIDTLEEVPEREIDTDKPLKTN